MRYNENLYFARFQWAIEKINYQWFLHKKNDFLALIETAGQDSEVLTVHEPSASPVYKDSSLSDYFLDPETEAVVESPVVDFWINTTQTVTITAIDYCFSYLPLNADNFWGQFPHNEESVSPGLIFSNKYNGKEVAKMLLKDISEYMPPNTDPKGVTAFVNNVIIDFQDELNSYIRQLPDAVKSNNEYNGVLMQFKEYFKGILREKYMRELIFVDRETYDYLDFNLNQNQLAALLVLLQNANILKSDRKDIVAFAAKHFRFDDGDGLRLPKSANDFSKFYGQVGKPRKGQRTPAMAFIFDILKTYINK